MKKKVIIEVRGGVAEVTQCPKDVEVEIIDWDNIKATKRIDKAEQTQYQLG